MLSKAETVQYRSMLSIQLGVDESHSLPSETHLSVTRVALINFLVFCRCHLCCNKKLHLYSLSHQSL